MRSRSWRSCIGSPTWMSSPCLTVPEYSGQLLARPVEARFHGAFGDVEDSGDLADRKALHVGQHQYRAELLRPGRQGRGQGGTQLDRGEGRVDSADGV